MILEITGAWNKLKCKHEGHLKLYMNVKTFGLYRTMNMLLICEVCQK